MCKSIISNIGKSYFHSSNFSSSFTCNAQEFLQKSTCGPEDFDRMTNAQTHKIFRQNTSKVSKLYAPYLGSQLGGSVTEATGLINSCLFPRCKYFRFFCLFVFLNRGNQVVPLRKYKQTML